MCTVAISGQCKNLYCVLLSFTVALSNAFLISSAACVFHCRSRVQMDTEKGRDGDVTQVDDRKCWDLFHLFLFINLAFNPLG